MPARSTNSHAPVTFLPVDLDARRLVKATTDLCEKIAKWKRYAMTERMLSAVLDAGMAVNAAVRTFDVRTKVRLLASASSHLDRLYYLAEVAVTAGYVTAGQKAIWDEQFEQVRRQVTSLLNSQQMRLRPQPSGEAESRGTPSGETSNKKDAPSHAEDRLP